MYNRRKDYGISPTTPTCRERCPLRGGRRPAAGGAHVPPHPPRTDVVPQEKRGVGFAQLPLKGTLFVHRLALLYSVYTFQAPRDDAEVTGTIKHGECVRRVGPLVRRNGRQWLRVTKGYTPWMHAGHLLWQSVIPSATRGRRPWIPSPPLSPSASTSHAVLIPEDRWGVGGEETPSCSLHKLIIMSDGVVRDEVFTGEDIEVVMGIVGDAPHRDIIEEYLRERLRHHYALFKSVVCSRKPSHLRHVRGKIMKAEDVGPCTLLMRHLLLCEEKGADLDQEGNGGTKGTRPGAPPSHVSSGSQATRALSSRDAMEGTLGNFSSSSGRL